MKLPTDVEILEEIDRLIEANTEGNFANVHRIFDRHKFQNLSIHIDKKLQEFQDLRILAATNKEPLGFYILEGIPADAPPEIQEFLRNRKQRRRSRE
jgi:hypothetical protein